MFERLRKTITKAQNIVNHAETQELVNITQEAEIAVGTDRSNAKALSDMVRAEVKRLEPHNTFDHEEAMEGINVYTNGRKDGSKVRMSRIQGDKWLKKGE